MPLDIDIIGPPELIPSVRAAITSLTTTYTKGQRVHLSDGTPEPPRRFTKKHRQWQINNRDGFVLADEGSTILFDPTGHGHYAYREPKSKLPPLPIS